MDCFICKNKIDQNKRYLQCSECSCLFHLGCLKNVKEDDYNYIVSSKCIWKCVTCESKKLKRGDDTPITPTTERVKFDFPKEPSVQSSAKESDSDMSEHSGTRPKIICGICKKGFSFNARRAVCCKCQSSFHLKCIDMTKEQFVEKEKDFVCNSCACNIEMSTQNVTLKDLLQEMQLFRQEVKNQNKEFTNSLNTYSEWLMEQGEKIKEVDIKLTSLVQDIDNIKQENVNLKLENKALLIKVNNLEQTVRVNTVEIHGVPFQKEEKIMEIINKIATVIGFDFNGEMIDNCYRLKPVTGSTRPAGIVVQFLRRLDKELFVKCRRMKRNLNSRDLGFLNGDASVIYINDSLTPEKRKLLNAARVVKRDKSFTYLWVNNGRILMRKAEGTPFIEIKNIDDLDKLK